MIKRLLTSMIGTTLAAASVLAIGPVATAAGATTPCPGGNWSSSTLGLPTAAHAGVTGAALWRQHDNNTYSLRVSHSNTHPALFAGTIVSDGTLVYVGRHLEGGDVIVSRSAHKIVFVFTNRGRVDGIDFAPLCATNVKIAITMNRAKLPTDEIVIGAANTNPTANPFTLVKS